MLDLLGSSPSEQIAAGLALAGAVASVVAFLRNQGVANRESMLARYDTISRSYIEFQTLSLSHPSLETSWYALPDDHPRARDPEDEVKRNILFDILTTTLERAFITYRVAPKSIKASQWPGWLAFARAYAARADYRAWWRNHVFDFENERWRDGASQYDLELERFMKSLLMVKSTRDDQ